MTWIIRSKTQPHLRDDVALDLVRPAIDRRLAHVEIGRRGAMGVIGADRMLVVARKVVGPETAEIGRAIMADRLQRQFGQPLLDLAALDLEQARFRPWPLAGVRTSQPARSEERRAGNEGSDTC